MPVVTDVPPADVAAELAGLRAAFGSGHAC
jgi:hypothetical protein